MCQLMQQFSTPLRRDEFLGVCERLIRKNIFFRVWGTSSMVVSKILLVAAVLVQLGFILSWQVHDHYDYCSAPRQSRFKCSHRQKINKATDQMFHIIGQTFCFVGFISDVTFDVKSISSKTLLFIIQWDL